LSIVTSVVATALTVSAVTPAVSVLQRAGVPFSLHEYTHDANTRSFGDEAVEKLGWPAERVFKTLVVSVDGDLQVACLPVSSQLDLKRLGKRAKLAGSAAHRSTGYVAGGTSPLGQRKQLPTHVDASALEHETILVNGGRRGLQVELDPNDLVRLTAARVHALASRA
jgi:Cys-tRNA(Pro)/Cys-tRNA(Cys) deacylase